jgi:hypothetical protein
VFMVLPRLGVGYVNVENPSHPYYGGSVKMHPSWG